MFSRSLMVMGALLLASQVANAAITYKLVTGPDLTAYRYSVEVRYVGGAVLNDQNTPALGNLNPSVLAGKILNVYKDGRVIVVTPPPTNFASVAVGARFDSLLTPLASYSATLPASWGDYDNDGDLDLPLNRNDGTAFSEIPGFRSLLNWGNYHGSSWCDYDKDGDLDLVILSYQDVNPVHTLLLRNDNGVFTDVAPMLGMDVSGYGETAVWADFDGDGWPDLFAPYYAHLPPYQSFLYHNNGDGSFTDVSDEAGVAMRDVLASLKPEGADAVDWDNDGDLDLYCASHLFINDGTAHFTDVRAAVGLPSRFDEGCSFLDYDNDGDYDLYIRYFAGAELWRNDNGQFTSVAAQAGIVSTTFMWGDAWADVNNDGNLDLLLFEQGIEGGPPRVSRLYLNEGDGTFTVDPTFTLLVFGQAAWADLDNDGDVDFVDNSPPTAIYSNRLMNNSNYIGSSLAVRVLDEQGLPVAHRATVVVRRTSPDPLVLTRAVGAGATYLTQNGYTVHFGLGIPGTVQRNADLTSYPKNQTVKLTAVPSPGYHFVSWNGDAAGKRNPLNVKMNGDKTIKALFTKTQSSLTMSSDSDLESSQPVDNLVGIEEAERFSFALESFGPNPIRHGVLTAHCTLPVGDPVQLELFDISGRRAVTSEKIGLNAGRHALTLNLESGLSPGCYLLQVTQGSHRQTGRVVLVR